MKPSTQLQIENIGEFVGCILDYFGWIAFIAWCLVTYAILTGAV